MKIAIKNTKNEAIGVLSYSKNSKEYTFNYDENFKGFAFGDINVKDGRVFTLKHPPRIFNIDDSYVKQKIIEKHGLSRSEHLDWEILSLMAKNNDGFKGFIFSPQITRNIK